MDDLYQGWSGLEDAFSRLEELVLAPLVAGRTARFEAYDWAGTAALPDATTAEPAARLAGRVAAERNDASGLATRPGPGAGIVIEPGELLVVEGCGCAPRAAERWIDTLVWWDGPWPRRRAAVVARDGVAVDGEIDAWEAATQRHYRRERTRQRADLRLVRGGGPR